jgi:hypothetical protein
MMVRDAEDEENIDWSASDRIFGSKYTGQLEQWGNWQGIDQTYMKYLWRSHWVLPAPGQLYDMFHRFRRLETSNPLYLSQEKIKSTLQQNDYHPDWVDRFVEVSFHPLNASDATSAFMIGTLSSEQLNDAFAAVGYDDNNSEILVKYNERKRRIRYATGFEARRLFRGLINDQEFTDLMSDRGASQEDINYAIGRADIWRASARRKSCIAALRRRFLIGETIQGGYDAELLSQGVDIRAANDFIDAWHCERASRGKYLPAGSLCGMYDQGLIDAVEFQNRLDHLGWDHDDGVLFVASCTAKLADKRRRAEEAAQRKHEAQMRADTREQERLAHQSDAAGQRFFRAAEKSLRAREMRERRLLEAAKNFASVTKSDILDSIPMVKGLYQRLKNTTTALVDEIIQTLVVVSRAKSVADSAGYETAVRTALDELINPDSDYQDSSNGRAAN